MRLVNGQTIGEKEERVDELSECVIDLTPRTELAPDTDGNSVVNQETDAAVYGADDSSQPIEFITENGYSIVRPWESGNSPRPAGGRFRFGVSDGFLVRTLFENPQPDTVRAAMVHGQPGSKFLWRSEA